MGKNKGFNSRLKEKAPHCVVFHCMIHRQALASKHLSEELNETLKTVIMIVNFIKARPTNKRLFAELSSTADYERGFKLMKQVKSDWRSYLRPDTLSDLSSPDIEHFDPDSAIHLWHQASVRTRRPDFMERVEKNRKTQHEDEKETSEEEDDDSEED
ncbi:hypothetical protein DPEC_G00220240 [Dallia pectoralis]|uniref:Uncharacterized protein n=1 Tax=Dallia pectoralis TaxID=75939 RepID=A0ACC2G3Q1_DALPE|nr:hypothetical protein DPEC_G00220240 [Dallia pectoralis]